MEFINEEQDIQTIRELTETYRNCKVTFRRFGGKDLTNSKHTTYRFHGIISHASSLESFVVEYGDSLEKIPICDIKKIVKS